MNGFTQPGNQNLPADASAKARAKSRRFLHCRKQASRRNDMAELPSAPPNATPDEKVAFYSNHLPPIDQPFTLKGRCRDFNDRRYSVMAEGLRMAVILREELGVMVTVHVAATGSVYVRTYRCTPQMAALVPRWKHRHPYTSVRLSDHRHSKQRSDPNTLIMVPGRKRSVRDALDVVVRNVGAWLRKIENPANAAHVGVKRQRQRRGGESPALTC